MYRLPNPFHTPASHAQAASGGGCTSCCCCCVVTTIGSSILGAIYFANIEAESTQEPPQAFAQTAERPAISDEALSFPTTETPPDAPLPLENTNQASNTRVLRGFLGFFALPFALLIAWQVGESSGGSFAGALFIAGLVMMGAFALAHHLAGSRLSKGIVVAIAWMVGLALATAFELAIWWRF